MGGESAKKSDKVGRNKSSELCEQIRLLRPTVASIFPPLCRLSWLNETNQCIALWSWSWSSWSSLWSWSSSLQEKEVTLNNEAAGGAEAGLLSDFMQSWFIINHKHDIFCKGSMFERGLLTMDHIFHMPILHPDPMTIFSLNFWLDRAVRGNPNLRIKSIDIWSILSFVQNSSQSCSSWTLTGGISCPAQVNSKSSTGKNC